MAKPVPANSNSEVSSGNDRQGFTMEKSTELKDDGRTLIYYKFLPANNRNNANLIPENINEASKTVDAGSRECESNAEES